MVKPLLVLALVIAAVAALAVVNAGAAPDPERTAFSIALVQFERPAPAGADKAYDELMDPEFGCGDRGHIEYEVDPG